MLYNRFTFSILDSRTGSLRPLAAAAGANPLLQTNTFLRRKESDFFPMVEFMLSKQTSFPRLRTTLELRWNRLIFSFGSSSQSTLSVLVLSGFKLDCLLRNLLGAFSSSSNAAEFDWFQYELNSFRMCVASSGVKSWRWSLGEGGGLVC